MRHTKHTNVFTKILNPSQTAIYSVTYSKNLKIMSNENTPVERICSNCECFVIPKDGFMKGQQLCVCADKKNPKVPHVHATQPHFHCSTNQFKPK